MRAAPAQEDPGPRDLRPANPIGLAKAAKELPTSAKVKMTGRELRILQVTDLHFFADRDKLGDVADKRTIEDLKRMVGNTDPHILAVTGDLWHDNPDGKGQEYFEFALDQVVSLGKPWLFNWGNHDLLNDYAAAQIRLTEAKNSLYRGGRDGGNYRVAIENGDQKLLWELLCLNTTTQGVQAEQERWLKSRKPSSVPAFCFLHIPLLEYDTVWQKKIAKGIFNEAVCTYGEDGSAIEYLKNYGTVRACFCGHDHVNDYGGKLQGIEMVYGRATGHAGYGGEKVAKGGKLISVDLEESTYRWKSVFANGSEWVPG